MPPLLKKSDRQTSATSPTTYWRDPSGDVLVYHDDNVRVMDSMPAESVDAIVCDPPYGLEFMGKDWDKLGAKVEVCDEGMDKSHPFRDGSKRVVYGKSAASMQSWHQAWATSALRVAKPGAYLLAFGGSRTYHRLACAIEDAGWEIRDCMMWIYGSGFPKSLDVSKAIDKEAGAERNTVVVPSQQCRNPKAAGGGKDGTVGATRPWIEEAQRVGFHVKQGDDPVTDAAIQWQGWGTALKPAYEPVIVARKPLVGTVAQNVQQYGTGAINIDACRVGVEEMAVTKSNGQIVSTNRAMAAPNTGRIDCGTKQGRWPANVIHDGSEEVVSLFPAEAGGGNGKVVLATGIGGEGKVMGGKERSGAMVQTYDDGGSAARFFYCAKADSDDRGERCSHPTVKPTDLMRYLVRLVCAPGALVMDPFLGSGTTGAAAMLEGLDLRFIGIEREVEYVDAATGKIQAAMVQAGRLKLKSGPPQLKKAF